MHRRVVGMEMRTSPSLYAATNPPRYMHYRYYGHTIRPKSKRKRRGRRRTDPISLVFYGHVYLVFSL